LAYVFKFQKQKTHFTEIIDPDFPEDEKALKPEKILTTTDL